MPLPVVLPIHLLCLMELRASGQGRDWLPGALPHSSFEEDPPYQSCKRNESSRSQLHMTVGYIAGAACVHLAQSASSAAGSGTVTCTFSLPPFPARTEMTQRQILGTLPRNLSHFFPKSHPLAFSLYFSSNKRHPGTSEKGKDISRAITDAGTEGGAALRSD